MNEFGNVDNVSNNDANLYNDSLFLENEKAPRKKFGFLNKKFFIFLFIVLLLIAIFQVVYAIMTKAFSSYKLESDIPTYVYMNEPVEFQTKFLGDKTNRFTTEYSIDNEYTFSLLKNNNTGLNNSNFIIPIQEGSGDITVSGILNSNSSIFAKNVVSRKYHVVVCPEFSLNLLKFKNVSVVKGSFYNLGIDFGEDLCSEGITYEISNKSIATVNNLGMVSGLNVGSTNLTISQGNKKVIVPVYVTPTNISINSSKAKTSKVQLVSGEKTRVSFDYAPFNATNINIRYLSSNSDVASVSDKGLIEAKNIGTSTVRIFTENNTILGEMTVVVEDPSDKQEPATAIEVSEEEINLKKGESKKILSVVVPDGALNSKSKWDTSKREIITVDNNGVVFAREVGTAYVYITNGDVKKSVIVNVN